MSLELRILPEDVVKPLPVGGYRLTEHAQSEMARRGIGESEVAAVLSEPEQAEVIREGRVVYQSRIEFGDPARVYLLRVFVDVDSEPPSVVTAYRTSKVEKYWRLGG